MYIEHVGIAVRDIESALKKYELLGLKTREKHILEEEGLHIQLIDAGEAKIELLEPIAGGDIKTFLDKRGPGLHHIAFQVKDIQGQLKRLSKKGMELIDKEPRKGLGESKIAFIHPKSMNGVLIELVQSC